MEKGEVRVRLDDAGDVAEVEGLPEDVQAYFAYVKRRAIPAAAAGPAAPPPEREIDRAQEVQDLRTGEGRREMGHVPGVQSESVS